MKKVRIVLFGLGGYGGHYIEIFRGAVDPRTFELAGIVDPFAEKAANFEWVRSQGIPVYETGADFYANNGADLAVISTPIPLHKGQTVFAMKNGSHVLCEKPLVPAIQEIGELQEASQTYERLLGVGFQWSFCKPMLDFKNDILTGVLGKPLVMRAYSSWRRFDDYYLNSAWKGRIYDASGNLILDSVATNANAHHLSNIFFIKGGSPDTAQMPVKLEADVYRAKNIQSYDTCFIRGEFEDGCRFYFTATHSGDREHNPVFSYEFEKAVVSIAETSGNQEIIARFKDGRVKNYGNVSSLESDGAKVRSMISAITSGTAVTGTAQSAFPHLAVTNAIFDQAEIGEFPDKLKFRAEEKPGTFVKDLSGQAYECFEKLLMPREAGFSWANEENVVEIGTYRKFSGARFDNLRTGG